MHFGEFNPLDVLAAAAVQHSDPASSATAAAVVSTAAAPSSSSSSSSSSATATPSSSAASSSVSLSHPNTENNVKGGAEEGGGEGEDEEEDVAETKRKTTSTETSAETKGVAKVTTATTTTVNESNMVAPLVSEAVSNKPLALQSPLLGGSAAVRGVFKPKSSESAGPTKIVIPNKDGKTSKTLTVLKMKGPKGGVVGGSSVNLGSKTTVQTQGAEHAYAYLCPVDGTTKAIAGGGKMPDDDEGYCSRSSLDSPGQSSRSDSDAFEQEGSGFDSTAGTQRSPVIRTGRETAGAGPMSPPPPPRVTSPRPSVNLPPRASNGFATPSPVNLKKHIVTTSTSNFQKFMVVSSGGDSKATKTVTMGVLNSSLLGTKSKENGQSSSVVIKKDSRGKFVTTTSTTNVTLSTATLVQSSTSNTSTSSSSHPPSSSTSLMSSQVHHNNRTISTASAAASASNATGRLKPSTVASMSTETKTVAATASKPETVTVKKEPGMVTVKKELEMVTVKKEPGTVTVKKEPGMVTVKKELETVTVKKEPGTATVKKESVEATKDQEEMIDVTTFTAPVDQSLILTSSPSLPSTVSLPSTSVPAGTVSAALPASSSLPSTKSLPVATSSVPSLVMNSTRNSTTLQRQLLDTPRLPLLINTSLAHMVQSSGGGPVTYLLVPPPATSTKGANMTSGGGLVLSQLGAKNQYIIQDDLPPSTKLQNGRGPKLAVGGDGGQQVQHKAHLLVNSKAPTHAKPVSLLSKPAKASGALLCIDANTGRPVFSSPSQLGVYASKAPSIPASSLSSSSSSSSQLSTSSPITTSSSSSTLHSLENPDKQINIKISGSKVIDMASLQEISPGTVGKKPAATSIGNIGSLSLTKLDNASPVSPRTVSPLSRTVSPLSLSAASSFSPIGSGAAGSRSHTPLSMGGGDTVSLFGPSELDPSTLIGQSSSSLSHSTATTKSSSNNNSNMSARTTCHTYVKRKNSVGGGTGVEQKGAGGGYNEIGGMRLHPLIDHDYCMFTEFSAEIQSSIIATTESKLKTERKYSKKTKAARCSKVMRTPPPEKPAGRKKRKYTRRVPLDKLRQQRSVESTATLSIPSPSSVESLDLGSPESGLSSPPPTLPLTPLLKPESPGGKSTGSMDKVMPKPKTPTKRRDGRNYVKITGSYQDEFVYFATKKTSGRPRKYHDSVVSQASTESIEGPLVEQYPTPAAVAGINVFDWYRDLSNTDKSSRFGMEENKLGTNDCSPSSILASRTPEHDSEVVDLVMEMANDSTGFNQATVDTEYSQANMETFSPFVAAHSMQSETVITTPSDESKPLPGTDLASDLPLPPDNDIKPEDHHEDVSKPPPPNVAEIDATPNTPPVTPLSDPNPTDCHIDEAMVEEVRTMLSSMGEDELKMLSENLTSEASQSTPVKSEASADQQGFNAFLASYSTDSIGPSQSSAGEFDLDDIADSDLLPMSITEPILPALGTEDLKHHQPSTEEAKTQKLKDSNSTLNMLFADPCNRSAAESPLKQFVDIEEKHEQAEHSNFTDNLDRSELFPEINTPTPSSIPQAQAHHHHHHALTTTTATTMAGATTLTPLPPLASPSVLLNSAPPELTTVSMYWNDLPGLMLHGKQHVRLVDIHKQMLPAKDTGILKKRCQMMRLELVHCTDLQRDFLVRYAHAAKSKSTVLVSKEDATTLVSFYVEPRPRAPRLSHSHSSSMLISGDSMDGVEGGLGGAKAEGGGKLKLKRNLKADDMKQYTSGSVEDYTSSVAPPTTGGKNRRGLNSRRRVTSTCSSTQDDDESKRSGRTRNKKVNYAALHSGGYEDGPKSESTSPVPQSSPSLEHMNALGAKIREIRSPSGVLPPSSMDTTSTVTMAPQARVMFPEEREIRRLRNKQKKRPLMRKDREKLKRLRDKLRRKLRKLRNEMDKVRGVKSKVGGVGVGGDFGEEVNETTEERNVTIPSVASTTTTAVTVSTLSSPVIVEDVAATEFIEVVSPGPPAELLGTEGAGTGAAASTEQELVEIPQQLVVEDVNVEDSEEPDVEETGPPPSSMEQEMPAIIVHHRDNTSRSTTPQRNRWQEGYLELSLYCNKDSPCITCNTCRETFSVKKFIKHQHHQNKIDELCEVTLAQKLEPKCPAPMLTWQIWEQFEKRQAQFEEIAIREKQVLKLQRQEQMSGNPPPNQRLSGRVRKRKQLHPMESYVYAPNQNKRGRLMSESEAMGGRETTTEHDVAENSERITVKDNLEKIR